MNGVFSELLSDKTKTRSWYIDYANSVYSWGPWFGLGGGCSDGSGAGAFDSGLNIGNAFSDSGFRVALS